MDNPSIDAERERILAHEGCLRLDDATRRQAILRLKTVRGHLEVVLRMLEAQLISRKRSALWYRLASEAPLRLRN